MTRELQLAPGIVVRRVDAIDQARMRAKRYARLLERWIVRNPEIKNGEPVVRGIARRGAYPCALVSGGESDEVLDEDFPHIPAEAREVAVQYARMNPRRGRRQRPIAVG